MGKLKKIIGNILALLVSILSLGTISACTKGTSITVYQVPFEDAYIYNGEKYVIIKDLDYIYGSNVDIHQIGYAYPVYIFAGIPRFVKVYMYDNDNEGNLIHFDNVWAGNQFFYIKEGARFPDNSEMMDIEFSSILFGWNSASTQKNIVFKFKNVLSEEMGPESLTQDWEDQVPSPSLNPKERIFYAYLSNYPLIKKFKYIFDSENNIYVYCADAWHKVIDEKFKQLVIQIKEEQDRLFNG